MAAWQSPCQANLAQWHTQRMPHPQAAASRHAWRPTRRAPPLAAHCASPALRCTMPGLLALLLLLLHWAAPARGQRLCADAVNIEPISRFCQSLNKVCVDQGSYVLYENRHNPRHTAFEGVPRIDLSSVRLDYYGFGDVWGTEFAYPDPLLRPATSGEETKELQEPQFSRWCAAALRALHDVARRPSSPGGMGRRAQ
jgi:hypothetical protein